MPSFDHSLFLRSIQGCLGIRSRLKTYVVIPLCLIIVAAGFLEILFLQSKGHRAAVNSRATEQFGEALERAGIMTQPAASK
jgi:hypothetical protein